MASKKKITSETLKALGTDRLADLLLECCDNDPVLAKRVRLILMAEEGSDKLSAGIAKRIAAIGRSRAMVSWNRCQTYIHELDDLCETIVTTLGNADAAEAVKRLWAFIALSDGVIERLEDGHGEAEDVFSYAVENLGKLCLKVENRDEIALAERVFDVFSGKGYSVHYVIIKATGEALGVKGRKHLKSLLSKAAKGSKDNRRMSSALRDLADADNDVDAYIANVSAKPERLALEAPAIAERLLAAGRAEEALDWLNKPGRRRWGEDRRCIDLKIEALEKLSRGPDAQAERIAWFKQTLSPEHLRDYLRRLPDFEDFEAEREAIAHAEAFPDVLAALSFLVRWPDLEAASRLVNKRESEINGASYDILNFAAEHLSEKYPDAATQIYRRKVESVLRRGASKYYHHAARDLGYCAYLAKRIAPTSDFPDHDTYVSGLREKHGRKQSFWVKVKE